MHLHQKRSADIEKVFPPPSGATVPSGPRPLHYRGFTITLSYTHHTRLDSSGRVNSPTHTSLPDTQHSQETDNQAPAEFEPALPASERPQTHASDSAATGICIEKVLHA